MELADGIPGGPEAAIDDGLILPLRELILCNAPNLFKTVQDNELIAREIEGQGLSDAPAIIDRAESDFYGKRVF